MPLEPSWRHLSCCREIVRNSPSQCAQTSLRRSGFGPTQYPRSSPVPNATWNYAPYKMLDTPLFTPLSIECPSVSQNRSDKECQDEWLLLELKLYMLMNSQDSVGLLGFFANISVENSSARGPIGCCCPSTTPLHSS